MPNHIKSAMPHPTAVRFSRGCGVQNGVACGKVEGADPPTLAKRVQELAAERVAEKAEGGGKDGMEPELQAKLKKLIRCAVTAVERVGRGRLCFVLFCVRARCRCVSSGVS